MTWWLLRCASLHAQLCGAANRRARLSTGLGIACQCMRPLRSQCTLRPFPQLERGHNRRSAANAHDADALSMSYHPQLREEERLRQERSRGGDRGRERERERAERRAQGAQEREQEKERGVSGGSGAKEKYLNNDGRRERGVARARGGGRGVPLSKGSLREGGRVPGDGGVEGLESYEDDDHLAAVRGSEDMRVWAFARAAKRVRARACTSLPCRPSLSRACARSLSLTPLSLCVRSNLFVQLRAHASACARAWGCFARSLLVLY